MKNKETLEEVAEKFWLNDNSMTDNDRISYVNGFIEGAKWQAEQNAWYNEEQTNKRMNVIGQNGNDGTHYETK